MALQINSNSTAFNVFANYDSNMNGLRSAIDRLSRGTKAVNEDPPGVGISERMRSQARSSAMARSNIENGLSMLRTADSWLQKINDMLGRMHELSVVANDGTKTAIDKSNIATEFVELQDEIARITSRSTAAAKYNGLYLFRGGTGKADASGDAVETGSLTIQAGADINQKLTLQLEDLQVSNTDVIGTVHSYTYSTDHSVTGSTHATVTWASVIDSSKLTVSDSNAVGKLHAAIDHIANSRAKLGAQQNRLETTRSGLLAYEDNLRSAESKIRDVDMARESTELAKYQVLTQIGNAMLTQANQLPSSAMRLLAG